MRGLNPTPEKYELRVLVVPAKRILVLWGSVLGSRHFGKFLALNP